jgi:hypothetical protein
MLKILHSFIPPISDNNIENIIWKEQMYPQLLSALTAKKIYNNISIYTNEVVKKQIEDIGIPYDIVDTELLKNEKSKTFSYYKLKVFENVKEEFLHIDTDTILFKHFDFKNIGGDFLFAHPDQPSTKIINEEHLKLLTKSYSGLFFILEKQHSKFKIDNFKICEIPNMSIVYVKDFETFNLATKYSLEHYEKNRELIDEMGYGACYIEQLMIHLNLMEISEEYRNSMKYGGNFLSNNEFMFIMQERNGEPFNMNDYTFPIRFKMSLPKNNPKNDYKFGENIDPKIITFETRELSIPSIDFVKEMFDFDFYGIQHLTYNKWSKLFQCICIGYIHKHFGEEWLYRVHNHYKKMYPKYNLKTLSDGEKLYEEITGFKFEKSTTII